MSDTKQFAWVLGGFLIGVRSATRGRMGVSADRAHQGGGGDTPLDGTDSALRAARSWRGLKGGMATLVPWPRC